MNLLTRPKIFFSSKGQGMIELVFAIPFFFMFIYGVMEFSRLFVQAQQVRTLSREAANASFRDCTSSLDICVEQVVNSLGGFYANKLLPGFSDNGRVVVSVYGPDPDSTGVLLMSQWCAGSATGNGKLEATLCDSEFNENSLPSRDFIDLLGSAVIAEVFFDYQPLTPIKKILTDLELPLTLYEVTIY